MAPLPSPGNVIRIEWRITDNASIDAGSRSFFSYSGGLPSEGALNTLAESVVSAWTANIAPLTNIIAVLVQVTCTDLSSASGAFAEVSASVKGTRSGDQLPADTCAVVLHHINRRYRGGRPKCFLACGTLADIATANTWTSAFTAEVLTGWEAYVAAIIATTGLGFSIGNLVNISYFEGFTVFTTPSGRARNIPTPRTKPLLDQVVNSTVDTRFGSQRRRLDL